MDSENQNKIAKRASRLYFFKANEAKTKNANNAKVYGAILPFKEIKQFLSKHELAD